MFVFNTMTGDLRVHRQAQTLGKQGYQVRVYAFLEPGLAEVERRSGYTLHRLDQRPFLTRFFDDRVLRRWKRARPTQTSSATPLPSSVSLPPDRSPVRPCLRPAPRSYRPGGSVERAAYRDYVSHINRRWAAAALAWKPHICHAHDVDALEAAGTLAQKCGAALVYDAHEIWNEQPFVRDEDEARHWKELERRWIARADALFTVNEVIASWMEQEYEVGPVRCLYNCQELQPLPEPPVKLSQRFGGKPVALYQGVIGLDRGLEELLASSRHQDQVVLAIRGSGERLGPLREMARANHLEVHFLEAVPSHQVVEAAAEADIGLIPFLPSCLNHYWSTPNKLFEYMMAGLPMAGSDLPELRRFVENLGLGQLFDPYSPPDIANCLSGLAARGDLVELGRRARRLAEETYCWERESQKLLLVYQDLGERR